MATTFWRAAFVIRNYGYDAALTVYKQMSGSSERTVTQREAYDQTSIAVWYLMKKFELPHNTKSPNLVKETLAEQLFNTAMSGKENVLTAKPDADQIQVSGSSVFVYDEATKLWKTGTLTLTAPVQHAFILSLPDGITTDTGSTVIRTGDAFVLMTSVKPAANSTASVSADLSWVDGGLKRYTPADAKATASDGKGFQDMIGVLIQTKNITSPFLLFYEEPKTPEENPGNITEDNAEETPEEKPEDYSGSDYHDPDQPDASGDVTDSSDQEAPATDENKSDSSDAERDITTAEANDPVSNNTTKVADLIVTSTQAHSMPAVTSTREATAPVALDTAAVSAPDGTPTAPAPQIVMTSNVSEKTVVTGDASQMGMYFLMFAAAATGFAVWFARKRRHNCRYFSHHDSSNL